VHSRILHAFEEFGGFERDAGSSCSGFGQLSDFFLLFLFSFCVEGGLESGKGFARATEEGKVEFVHGVCFVVVEDGHFEGVTRAEEMHFFDFEDICNGDGNLWSA
jgi:hypothetical protein